MANKPKRKGNGEGTIFYDKSRKRWRCQISYQKYSGEIARKSLSASTKTELIKKRNQLLKDIMEQKICETTDATIVDLLKEDAEYDHNMNRIQDSAYNRRLLTVRIIEKGSLAKIPITKIQTNQINDFLFSIKHYSNSVIDKVYSSMSKVYNLAIHKRLMGYNLMDSPFIRKPKSDKPTKKVVAFTVEEENDFLNYLKDMKINKNAIDYRPMFYIELFAGLRMGDDDDKIRLNQRKPSKYKGLSRFGPEKNLQRINKFMKERPTFYKKLIQMKENFRFYLRCFYCITKVVILQFNSEKQDRISS